MEENFEEHAESFVDYMGDIQNYITDVIKQSGGAPKNYYEHWQGGIICINIRVFDIRFQLSFMPLTGLRIGSESCYVFMS